MASNTILQKIGAVTGKMTSMASDVQDALVTVLSEKTLPVPELARPESSAV